MLRNLFRPAQANLFGYGLRRMSTIKVGDQLPPATLYEKGPDDKVDILKELKGKQALIVGVPGAFSGPCSEVHIPGYLNKLPDFISKGYRDLVVISVNDPFVVSAWRSSFGLKPESPNVSFFADSKAEFVKALGLDFDATEVFGNVRSKRFCLAVDDNKVVAEFVEPENTPVDVTAADKVFKQLPGLE
ncbi:hypothetical protein KL918_002629 [Ogataea parapolymorpha]|uniref:AHP1 Thiol-specific peroxiredoxin n=1 Tax=Ogataea parapolymorpha (strain ATCC 26012 / BCRC 20466 / JCM 22074 / NRRL Y-7560 / DL-1) TaxID=871575 RepID=W1QH72_OGAPD|nr:AHP1 Thiol-specific peroxiredoxin [Ogataea parapolymorpha DL-1]ESX00986.1 AHP1 Thiol-specific peroxiredoxin [Ogataea parapolymorpha DL-1]KAG7867190.1 hypothetical protein KL918_002629 [Ogataea parapolymorpha]KAG7870890.1 hypothetical protein KL916_004621 [Ogataea parapolymorpha]KAG7883991.1 hypothetical protein KL938_002576 [Ogataea parapolymorpha]